MDADSRIARNATRQPAPDAGAGATDPGDAFGFPYDAELTLEALTFAT
jgi:hypothetical protein